MSGQASPIRTGCGPPWSGMSARLPMAGGVRGARDEAGLQELFRRGGRRGHLPGALQATPYPREARLCRR